MGVSLADRLHKLMVLVCFGTTLYGTAVVGQRFGAYLLFGRGKPLEITNLEPAERIDPERLSDGPVTRV